MPNSKSRPNANQVLRLSQHNICEDRTALVKQEAEAERLAVEAKTARLRTLRLEKEATEKVDRQATGIPQTAPMSHRRKGTLSIKV